MRGRVIILFIITMLLAGISLGVQRKLPRLKAAKPSANSNTPCHRPGLKANDNRIFRPCVEVPPQGQEKEKEKGKEPNAPPPKPRPTPNKADGKALRPIPPLRDYVIGEWRHPGMVRYCNEEVSGRVRALVEAGYRISMIKVTGYADGYPNEGVSVERKLLPRRCQEIFTGDTVDDEELAQLRGCIVWAYLLESMGDKYGVGIFPKSESFDEPDGGKKGFEHRKVTVEIIYGR